MPTPDELQRQHLAGLRQQAKARQHRTFEEAVAKASAEGRLAELKDVLNEIQHERDRVNDLLGRAGTIIPAAIPPAAPAAAAAPPAGA